MKKITWTLEDHLCRCGGRVLKSASGVGPTGGGNPIHRCVDCSSMSTRGPQDICWCGLRHKGQSLSSYQCLPFSILDTRPELLAAFQECGCDPTRGEVGIVLRVKFRESKSQTP